MIASTGRYENLIVWKKLDTCSLNNLVIFKHNCLKFSKPIKLYVFYTNTLYSLVNICKLAILIMLITLHKLCSIKHDKSTVHFLSWEMSKKLLTVSERKLAQRHTRKSSR